MRLTSEKSMSATEVMEAYHTLWKIEESFRIMKTTLEVRPVYHFKTKRIEGHFVVCFLAFLMERKMELLLKDNDTECSHSPNGMVLPSKVFPLNNSYPTGIPLASMIIPKTTCTSLNLQFLLNPNSRSSSAFTLSKWIVVTS